MQNNTAQKSRRVPLAKPQHAIVPLSFYLAACTYHSTYYCLSCGGEARAVLPHGSLWLPPQTNKQTFRSAASEHNSQNTPEHATAGANRSMWIWAGQLLPSSRTKTKQQTKNKQQQQQPPATTASATPRCSPTTCSRMASSTPQQLCVCQPNIADEKADATAAGPCVPLNNLAMRALPFSHSSPFVPKLRSRS